MITKSLSELLPGDVIAAFRLTDTSRWTSWSERMVVQDRMRSIDGGAEGVRVQHDSASGVVWMLYPDTVDLVQLAHPTPEPAPEPAPEPCPWAGADVRAVYQAHRSVSAIQETAMRAAQANRGVFPPGINGTTTGGLRRRGLAALDGEHYRLTAGGRRYRVARFVLTRDGHAWLRGRPVATKTKASS